MRFCLLEKSEKDKGEKTVRETGTVQKYPRPQERAGIRRSIAGQQVAHQAGKGRKFDCCNIFQTQNFSVGGSPDNDIFKFFLRL